MDEPLRTSAQAAKQINLGENIQSPDLGMDGSVSLVRSLRSMKVSDSEGPWKRASDSRGLGVAGPCAGSSAALLGPGRGARIVVGLSPSEGAWSSSTRQRGGFRLLPPGVPVVRGGEGPGAVAFAHGEAASSPAQPDGQHDAARMHDDDHAEHPPGGARLHSSST
jgi:hypothetical protein